MIQKYDILIKENFLTNEECDQWIEAWKTYKTIQEDLSTGDMITKPNVLHITNHPQLEKEEKKLISKLSGCYPKNLNFNYAHVCEWNTGMEMGKHKDIYEAEFTSIIYLNDDYKGGETFIGDTIIPPKKGKLVSFWGKDILHGVSKIEGKRYTMPIWYAYPDKCFKRDENNHMIKTTPKQLNTYNFLSALDRYCQVEEEK
tara:strand:+ start:403 stop:1002 length:600 start_codon:yes stop_codon:yes gene_type:complete